MIIFVILLITVLVIGGCATPNSKQVWTRNTPGGTDEELDREGFECMKQSQREVVKSFGGGVFVRQTETNQELFNACIEARGYSPVLK